MDLGGWASVRFVRAGDRFEVRQARLMLVASWVALPFFILVAVVPAIDRGGFVVAIFLALTAYSLAHLVADTVWPRVVADRAGIRLGGLRRPGTHREIPWDDVVAFTMKPTYHRDSFGFWPRLSIQLRDGGTRRLGATSFGGHLARLEELRWIGRRLSSFGEELGYGSIPWPERVVLSTDNGDIVIGRP